MFEPNASWSLPAHLFMVSGWSARLHPHNEPIELHQRVTDPGSRRNHAADSVPDREAADLRVDRPHLSAAQEQVSWGYYVVSGTEPDCENDAASPARP